MKITKKFLIIFFITISLSGLLFPAVSHALNPFSQNSWLDLIYTITDVAGNIILSLAAWFLWLCGTMFNLSIVTFVVHMKTVIAGMPAIYEVWQTVRDLANMFFIFILLYIAIATILDSNTSYKKMLTNVVLVALFINFSFFFTGVMIDASNIVALQFYNGFAGGSCGSSNAMNSVGIDVATDKLANTANTTANQTDGCMSQKVVNALRLSTVYDTNSTAVGETPLSSRQNMKGFLVTMIMGSFLMIIIGGVFLTSAFLIFYRFVELIMLLMFSPIAFAAIALPATKKYWTEWKDKLTTQLIFAPVYFMFLWVVMKVVQSDALKTSKDGLNWVSGLNGNSLTIFGLIANYIIIIMMLGYSLSLAKRLGAKGSDTVTDFGKNFQGFIGKHTVGRAAGYLDEQWQKRTGVLGGTGFIGSHLRNATTAALVKKDMGFGSWDDRQKTEKERVKSNAEQTTKNKNEKVTKAGLDALAHPLTPLAPGVAMTTARQAQEDAHSKKIQDLANYAKTASGKDLMDMKAADVEALTKAGMLTPDKMASILDDDKNKSHNSKEKGGIREAYSKKVKNALAAHLHPVTGGTVATEKAAKDAIADLGEDGIKIIDPELTSGRSPESKAFIQMASGKQYQKIIESTYGAGKNTIRDTRLLPITDVFSAANVAASTPLQKDSAIKFFAKIEPKDIAGMDQNTLQNILVEEKALETLSPQRIKKIAEELSPGNPKGKTILDAIEVWGTNPANPHNSNIEKTINFIQGEGKYIL